MIETKCSQGKVAPLIGISAASSWAWGTSLIMGMEVCQEKGIWAFAIWAAANTLTLAVFGFLMNRGIIKPRIFDNRIVKGIALLIQMLVLIMQLNIINDILGDFIPSGIATYAITSLIGIGMVWFMFRRGLPVSVSMDIGKYVIAILSIVAILGIALLAPAGRVAFPETGASEYMWAAWSACVLFSGLIGDVQHWQRALADETRRSYYWGSLFFGIYMVGIFLMAHFEFNAAMNAVLLVACLVITGSVINAIAVAMHETRDRRFGALVTVAVCLLWGLGVGVGLIAMWSSFGIIRVAFAVLIVVGSLMMKGVAKDARLEVACEEQR